MMEYDIHTVLDGLTLAATVGVIYCMMFSDMKVTYQKEQDIIKAVYVVRAWACCALGRSRAAREGDRVHSAAASWRGVRGEGGGGGAAESQQAHGVGGVVVVAGRADRAMDGAAALRPAALLPWCLPWRSCHMPIGHCPAGRAAPALCRHPRARPPAPQIVPCAIMAFIAKPSTTHKYLFKVRGGGGGGG